MNNKNATSAFIGIALLQALEVWYLQSKTNSTAILLTMFISVVTWLVFAAAWYKICSVEWNNNQVWITKFRGVMQSRLIAWALIHWIIVHVVVFATYYYTSENSSARFIIAVFGSFGQMIIPEYWMGLLVRSVRKLEVECGESRDFKLSHGRHIKVDYLHQPKLCAWHRVEFESNRPHQDEKLWETRDITQTESAPWPLISYLSEQSLIVEVFI